MITNEQEIRSFFKSLTPVEIADSTYLFGIDFEKESLDSILDSVIALYREVKQLKDLVDSDFRKDSEEKILVPKDRDTQTIVIQNYYRKESVLHKILGNPYVYAEIKQRISERKQEETQHLK